MLSLSARLTVAIDIHGLKIIDNVRSGKQDTPLVLWTIMMPVAASSMTTNAKLCEVCSNFLDMHRLTHWLYPCCNPLPCSIPPIPHKYEPGRVFGSVDEIKRRRLICEFCKIVAESLDQEPSDLGGECRIKENEEFCSFQLPADIRARDPNITHFHFTQTSVIFDTFEAGQYHGPALPWQLEAKSARSSHYILNFQVKASSDAEAFMDKASPHAEQEYLRMIGGRYVSAEANIPLIRTWLHQCEHQHGKKCMPPVQSQGKGARGPTFLVDVIESRLVDTPSRCRYVALSYVWGTAPVFTHLAENTAELRKRGSFRSFLIPATIRDAITLVHAIGERYLWVDSLCIIQDNWRMMGEEIMRMGTIYSGALFTIIAAAGDHANSGLPGIEQGSRGQVQKILKLDNCELLTTIEKPDKSSNSTWSQRAWTFQEQALSDKVLVFSEGQVYWSCRVASYLEERALEKAEDIRRFHPSLVNTITKDRLSHDPLEPSAYLNLYYTFLAAYRQRYMTYKTDILNAFNGVSETLATIHNDSYFWGHPESLFSYAMTWDCTGYFARNHVEVPILDGNSSAKVTPIPSWSWAAWSGEDQIHLPFFHAGENDQVRPVIHFDIVDSKHRLVRIKERSWPDHPGVHGQALWKNEQQSELVQSHMHHDPPLRHGQLRFWTSFANLRAIWSAWAGYMVFPHSSFVLNPSIHTVLQQDFIVVAAGSRKRLILLAIEWKDGVAYRIGRTYASEADWVRAENRQWRLITLG